MGYHGGTPVTPDRLVHAQEAVEETAPAERPESPRPMEWERVVRERRIARIKTWLAEGKSEADIVKGLVRGYHLSHGDAQALVDEAPERAPAEREESPRPLGGTPPALAPVRHGYLEWKREREERIAEIKTWLAEGNSEPDIVKDLVGVHPLSHWDAQALVDEAVVKLIGLGGSRERYELCACLHALGVDARMAERGHPEEKTGPGSLGVIDIGQGPIRWVNVRKEHGSTPKGAAINWIHFTTMGCQTRDASQTWKSGRSA